MFLLKKIISPLFLPLSISMLIIILGLLYLHFRRRMRLGKFFILLGILLLIGFSLDYPSSLLLRSLEHRTPAMSTERLQTLRPEVKWIAVLGGGHSSDPALPALGQLSDSSLARLAEGVRIHRALPEARLLLSGGAVFTRSTEGAVMAKAAQTFNLKSGQIVVESASRDTEEQALLIRKIVGADRFILVTSASHMPRSLALFRKAGMDPIPAPAQFHTGDGDGDGLNPASFYPSAASLLNSQIAVYEYLGILWSTLRGKI